jgi:UDP-N-acetylglucosamine 2-epimerase (non-hydrolysing)
VKVAHVEAGIRSGDWTMPEEINRLVTDSITNYFFTTTEVANQTLRQSGIAADRIFWVGNTMIDTLLKHRPRFVQPSIWKDANLEAGKYIVMTLHRPANVDEESNLKYLIEEIIAHTHGLPLVFPVHPRTAKVLEGLGINAPQLHIVEPMGYLEFNYLVEHAKAVITDSGGITEETTVMGVPCMTLRNSTERPETVDMGTNELLGVDPKAIGPAMEKLFSGNWKKGSVPPLWDGETSGRIVERLLSLSNKI